eukprot:gnl/MRDRNA2_/MRDRNA2_93728_c0_seq1.p1 gnl/MRDRNA2_/MRDRNA2_93728_c0~~gnl/MRDRNA2_/MRDRNA2_93728_c0_seq1.p1  ORF type:complete len:127 (-),score=6.22 gnl/MRDRNA2_/MRDRNA2_93728_c0_seq1:70-450(-)
MFRYSVTLFGDHLCSPIFGEISISFWDRLHILFLPFFFFLHEVVASWPCVSFFPATWPLASHWRPGNVNTSELRPWPSQARPNPARAVQKIFFGVSQFKPAPPIFQDFEVDYFLVFTLLSLISIQL